MERAERWSPWLGAAAGVLVGAALVLGFPDVRGVDSTMRLAGTSSPAAIQVYRVGAHASSAPPELSGNRVTVDPTDDIAARLERVLELLVNGDESAATALAALALGDSSSSVREEAVAALGDVGGVIGIQTLTQALNDTNADVQEAAVRAFVDIGSDDAVRALTLALSDPDPALRGAAVDALADIGSAAAVGALRQAARDESDSVREAAVNYLAERAR